VLRDEGWPSAAAMIERNWDDLIGVCPEALLDAIKLLPGEALVETPSLLVGADYLRHVVSGADPKLFRRNVDLVSGTDGLRERLVSLTGRTADHRTAGRLGQAVEMAQHARRLIAHADNDELAAVRSMLPHLALQWGRSFDLADKSMALAEYEEGYALAQLTGQVNVARRVAGSLAWSHADAGNAQTAQLWLERAQQLGTEDLRYDISQHVAAALLAHYRLDPQSDESVARSFFSPRAALRTGEYWAAALWVRALHARDVGEAALVKQAIENEVAGRPRGLVTQGANRRYITAARWRVGLVLGTSITALSTDEFGGDSPGEIALESAYRLGDFHGALKLKPHEWRADSPRQRASMLLISAACRLRLGREESAIHAFTQADSIIAHQNILSLYTLLHPDDLRELSARSGRGPSADTIARLAQNSCPTTAPEPLSLTPREAQLMRLLVTDLSNQQIAASLFITSNTLKSTARRLYRKLDVHSREEAADIAHRLGLD
jgi:DNA-binding CsgD family transcriptional regulator